MKRTKMPNFNQPILLLLLFLSGMLNGKAQTSSNDTLTRYVKHYNNGQINIEYFYNSQRKKDSLETCWYSNGQLKSKRVYKNGDFHGPYTEWYKNGQLKSKGTTIKHRRKGQCAKYYPNGQVKYNAFFHKDIPLGKVTRWFANGNKMNQIHIELVDNNKYDPKYHSRGIIRGVDTITTKNMGKRIQWYENGVKKEEQRFSRKGKEKFRKERNWYENGQLKLKGNSRLKNGTYKEWYENGQLKLKCKKKDNISNGTSKFWHENGQLSGILVYKNKKQVLSKNWNKMGQQIAEFIRTDSTYITRRWDDNGKLTQEKFFDLNWTPIKKKPVSSN